jgi:hypothetical protein
MTSPSKANPPEKNTPRKGKKGKTTDQLMHQHLQDKGHTITDEDIESLDLNLGHPTKKLQDPEKLIPEKDDRPEEEKKPDNGGPEHKKKSTWDVLGG